MHCRYCNLPAVRLPLLWVGCMQHLEHCHSHRNAYTPQCEYAKHAVARPLHDLAKPLIMPYLQQLISSLQRPRLPPKCTLRVFVDLLLASVADLHANCHRPSAAPATRCITSARHMGLCSSKHSSVQAACCPSYALHLHRRAMRTSVSSVPPIEHISSTLLFLRITCE